MRQVVNRLYTFQVRAEEPGFLERIARWMDVASRWDEPKLDDAFLRATTQCRSRLCVGFPNPYSRQDDPRLHALPEHRASRRGGVRP